jgi:hypothetical protein
VVFGDRHARWKSAVDRFLGRALARQSVFLVRIFNAGFDHCAVCASHKFSSPQSLGQQCRTGHVSNAAVLRHADAAGLLFLDRSTFVQKTKIAAADLAGESGADSFVPGLSDQFALQMVFG